jgi:hypothetical protein
MIPKRALFYWSGGEASDLRKASPETFSRLNPDWHVIFGTCVDDMGFRQTVNASDLWRYQELASGGGIYFDTDMIFLRPIPEDWLDCDVLAPCGDDWRVAHIACLGGSPNNPYWAHMAKLAEAALGNGDPPGCQTAGIKLFQDPLHVQVNRFGLKGKRTEPRLTLPVPWHDTERVWSKRPLTLPSDTVALHWFGGDPLSRDLEFDPPEGCALMQVLRKAMESVPA